jgi:amino acid transporter
MLINILNYRLTTSVLVLFDFHIVVEMESIFYSCHAIILCLTFIRLKFSEPNMERPFAVPFRKVGAILLCIFPFAVAGFNIAMTDWKIQVIRPKILLYIYILIYYHSYSLLALRC